MGNINIISNVLFIFSYLSFLSILVTFIIKYYTSNSENEYIWFCSKILTVNKLISDNNNKVNVFYNYNSEGNKTYLTESPKTYLDYLDLITEGGCKKNYNQCGILDTYGNIFCLPDNYQCPINEIKIDSSSVSTINEYQKNGYHYFSIYGDNENKLYYKIGSINSGIIAYWKVQNDQPKFIDNDNFIFDTETYKEVFDIDDDEEEEDGDDDDDDDLDPDDFDDDDDKDKDNEKNSEIGKKVSEKVIDLAEDAIKDLVKSAKIKKLINYIDDKINDENNIDYNFTKISNNQYVKNYIGFKDKENVKNFDNIDFSLYKNIFPNHSAVTFSYICGIIFIALIIYHLVRIKKYKNENPLCTRKCCLIIYIIFYSISFLGFFIYTIEIYIQVISNESFELAKNIKADKFIEDFLKDFVKPFENINILIICSLIFLSISAILFVLSFIIKPLQNCLNKNNTNNNYNYNANIINNNANNINNNINYNDGRRIVFINQRGSYFPSQTGMNINNDYYSQNIRGQQYDSNANQRDSSRVINEGNVQVFTNQDDNINNINNENNEKKLNQQNLKINVEKKNAVIEDINDLIIDNENNQQKNNASTDNNLYEA